MANTGPKPAIIVTDGGPVSPLPCLPARHHPDALRTAMPAASTTEHFCEPDDRTAIEPIAMRVPDACHYLGIGRSTLYVLIARGEIEIVKLGSSTLVVTESLRQLIARRRMPRATGALDRDC